MKGILLGIVTTAIAFFILTKLMPNIDYSGEIPELLLIAVVFGVANGLVKPVIKLFTFPINVMTLGLFGVVINLVLFMGVAYFSKAFTIAGWPGGDLSLDVIGTALIASIVLGILTSLVGMVVKD